MRTEIIHFNDKRTDVISYFLWLHGDDNQSERARMKKILARAIQHELTDRQRDCIIMKYLKEMKNDDIAKKLGLSKSTVSRHISAGKRRLKKIASYYSKGVDD